MAVTIKGLGSLQAKLKKLDPATRAAVTRGVGLAGTLVEGSAKTIAPVDTGELRRSINTSTKSLSDGAQAIVGATAPHAIYLEFGTSRQRAQPYLRPALQKNKANAKKLIITEIVKAHRSL